MTDDSYVFEKTCDVHTADYELDAHPSKFVNCSVHFYENDTQTHHSQLSLRRKPKATNQCALPFLSSSSFNSTEEGLMFSNMSLIISTLSQFVHFFKTY